MCVKVCLTPAGSFSIMLVACSWLSSFSCQTEILPTRRSIELIDGGAGEDGGMTAGSGGGIGEDNETVEIGEGRGAGEIKGVGSEEGVD